ncbi:MULTISPECIES: hypothetical protein [unclassified Thioalkalivibrio]|uniref:hypothetical protein n=1 Tax=unclassified Thioalkalivibrio TaxID=2621013 RepID=UPI000373769B|nr:MULTISPECIES: hypothetical protein [unclassified Thioalkalivibrio]
MSRENEGFSRQEAFLVMMVESEYVVADADEKGQGVFYAQDKLSESTGICVDGSVNPNEVIFVLPPMFDELLSYRWTSFEIQGSKLVLWAESRIEGRFWSLVITLKGNELTKVSECSSLVVHPHVEECSQIDPASYDSGRGCKRIERFVAG